MSADEEIAEMREQVRATLAVDDDWFHTTPSPARRAAAEEARQRRADERIAADTAAREAAPCRVPMEAGDRDGAIAACQAQQAHRTCIFSTAFGSSMAAVKMPCPRGMALAEYRQRSSRIDYSKIPDRYRLPLLAAMQVREDATGGIDPAPRVPLLKTAAMTAARAFAARTPTTIAIPGEGKITVRGDETWLLLAGDPGVGKSLAAAWVLAADHGRWYRASDITRIRDGFEPDEVIDQPCTVVIDDLGTEHVGASEYALSVIESVLCGRYDHGRPTVITLNLNREDFRRRYGTRIDDRVTETGLFVELPGESLRGKLPRIVAPAAVATSNRPPPPQPARKSSRGPTLRPVEPPAFVVEGDQ